MRMMGWCAGHPGEATDIATSKKAGPVWFTYLQTMDFTGAPSGIEEADMRVHHSMRYEVEHPALLQETQALAVLGTSLSCLYDLTCRLEKYTPIPAEEDAGIHT
ncbi:hypothetical protein PMIN06_006986 [Paraphaeosphaeria minitans]